MSVVCWSSGDWLNTLCRYFFVIYINITFNNISHISSFMTVSFISRGEVTTKLSQISDRLHCVNLLSSDARSEHTA